MTNDSLIIQSAVSSKLTYPAIVEHREGGVWSAQLLGWSECRVEAATREEALRNLEQHLTERLAKAEIVHLEIPTSLLENPWLELAGKYKDDPQFQELKAEMERERRELDAEMWQDEDETHSEPEV